LHLIWIKIGYASAAISSSLKSKPGIVAFHAPRAGVPVQAVDRALHHGPVARLGAANSGVAKEYSITSPRWRTVRVVKRRKYF